MILAKFRIFAGRENLSPLNQIPLRCISLANYNCIPQLILLQDKKTDNQVEQELKAEATITSNATENVGTEFLQEP